jgi:hypothetical protein
MGLRTIALACTAVLTVASSVSAQNQSTGSLTALQTAVACQSPPILAPEPVGAVRIVGSQDVVGRSSFGAPEVLVLDGGTGRDVKVNNLYYVRRILRTAETLHDKHPHTVMTLGWVRVVASNEAMSLVSPEHSCSDMRAGDYLEPFVAPVPVEGGAMLPLVQGELNFDAYAKVLHGELERRTASTNEFATIEHGLDRNVKVGTRFAVYRDLQLSQNPLKRIGEAIAVSVGPSMTLVRVTSARDAIFIGDLMVPRTADGVKVEPPQTSSEAADRRKVAEPNRLSGCQNAARVPPQNPRCGG